MIAYRQGITERQPPARSGAPPVSAGAALPGRLDILVKVTGILTRGGRRWAWLGPAEAANRWLGDVGPQDLDLWYDPGPPGGDDPVAAIEETFPCARVAEADDRRRLRHTSLAIETPDGPAVVDLTRGDLRVGPILLVPADEITINPTGHRMTGAAAVADLLVRPMLRGRMAEAGRLAQARAAWERIDSAGRGRLTSRLAGELGEAVTGALIAIAEGARPDPGLPRAVRLRLIARSLALGTIAATWAQRRTVWPAGRAAGPLGLRTRGVLVALVGTDGAGKSTVASGLHERLRRYGLATSTAYFGMARGNLPGVDLARRLLRVGDYAPSRDVVGDSALPRDVVGDSALPRDGANPPAALDHPVLRRAAAWFYAGEYAWRYVRMIGRPLARRHVVIVDRWIYDLRESPWPGSRAARVAEFLLPAPDVVVLPDAPIALIHDRKPERPLAEQYVQQERFRRLLAEHPARHAEVVVDTSGRLPDPLAALVATVVQAAHGARRREP